MLMENPTTVELPLSLRTASDEKAYQEARANKKTVPLELEPSIKMWKHWRLIDNAFPYTMAFQTHHMLVPRRPAANRFELKPEERAELEEILKTYVFPNYDLFFENTPKRRSNTTLYHLHLATYHDARSNMSL